MKALPGPIGLGVELGYLIGSGKRSFTPAVRKFSDVPFSELDTTSIARSLAQIVDHEGDLTDAFFERSEQAELCPADEAPGVRIRREQGFSVRLVRQGRTWMASRDEIDPAVFSDAVRQVARVLPTALYASPGLPVATNWEARVGPEMQQFPRLVTRSIRNRLAGFPLRLRVRKHRRWVRVVGTQLAPEPQSERYYSCEAEMPWGRFGLLLSDLDEAAADRLAGSLTRLFRARQAPLPDVGIQDVVLGPAAAAVLLHEVVAHALETDTLVLGGRIEAAIGVQVGAPILDVLDDPSQAPEGVARTSDDEGMVAVRRWLLRQGVVEQPLADMFSAHHTRTLIPGAGRRSDRHMPPVPRSTHLELLPGELSADELAADISSGLFLTECTQGSLDPISGRFSLSIPYGHRLRKGRVGDLVGPCRLVGRVSDLLGSVTGLGAEVCRAGAGWCAKGGVRLPVWATTPAMRLEKVQVDQ